MRDVLQRGTSIERHCEAKGLGYETFSAKLDAAAREYADRLRPHLAAAPADDAIEVTTGWLTSLTGGSVDPDLNLLSDYYGKDPVAVVTESGWLAFIHTAKCDGEAKWYACLVTGDGFDGSEDYLCEVPTRGHVRRLVSALNYSFTPVEVA